MSKESNQRIIMTIIENYYLQLLLFRGKFVTTANKQFDI